MARTAVTLGITENGEAEIISHPNVAIDEQILAFNQLSSKKGKYSEIVMFPSRGRMRRKVFTAREGGVNFNAAHRVELQQDKKAAKDLADLTPSEGATGGVNFNAAHPVELQGDKKAKLPDLNARFKATPSGGKKKAVGSGGVNFGAAAPVKRQDDSKASSKKSGSRGPSAPSDESAAATAEAALEASKNPVITDPALPPAD